MGNAPHKLLQGAEDDMPIDISKKGLIAKARAKPIEEETRWDRVKKIFTLDDFNQVSPQLELCRETTILTGVGGALIGGVGRSRVAYVNFFRSNAHTAFETPMKARTKLQESMIIGFGSGAFRVGWRATAFSFIYCISSAVVSAFRGKSSLSDPAIGGAVAGFIYKFKDGPSYSLAGLFFGGVLGLFGGVLTNLSGKLSGKSIDDLYTDNYMRILAERESKVNLMKSLRSEVDNYKRSMTITELHDDLLEKDLASNLKNTDNNTVTIIDKNKIASTNFKVVS